MVTCTITPCRAAVRLNSGVSPHREIVSTSVLLLGVLFSSIGAGYLIYARKQRAPVPLIFGLALVACPYFISNAWVLFAFGCAAAIAPWVIRL